MTLRSAMTRRELALAGILAPALAALPPSRAMASTAITIKLGWATADAPQDSFAIAARAFKTALEREAPGIFDVQLYPNRQIGDEKQLVEGLRLGTVDAAVITNAAYAQFEPAFQLNDLPFLYESEAKVFETMDGQVGRALGDKIEKRGVRVLAYLAGGYRHMLNNKRPVHGPADIVGVKYRVHNAVAIDMYTLLGAGPVPMSWGETTTALQQGAVDGLDLPIGVMDSLKISDSVKFLSLTGHTYSGAALGMSKRRFDRLAEAQKEAVLRAAATAAAEQRKINAANEALILDTLRGKGLAINDVADKSEFRSKVRPIYEKFRADIGSDLLAAALGAAK